MSAPRQPSVTTPTAPVVPGIFTMSTPPQQLLSLYSIDEWETFEARVRRWLGEASTRGAEDGRVLTLDEALLVPSAYTYAVAVKAWMTRLGMTDLAMRIFPEDYSDTDAFKQGQEDS